MPTPSYDILKAFPAPQMMCNAEDRKWAMRNAIHLFNNVKKGFLKQAKPAVGQKSSDKQTVRVGHETPNGPALWVRNFSGDGKVLDWPLQEQVGIDFCNEQLEGTGWRVVKIVPTLVYDTTGYTDYESWDRQSAWYQSIRPLNIAVLDAERACRNHQSENDYQRYSSPVKDHTVQIERERLAEVCSLAYEARHHFTCNNPRPGMPALEVMMEYSCMSAAKYPGQ